MNRSVLIVQQSFRSSQRWFYKLLVSVLFGILSLGIADALDPPVVTVPGRVALQDGKLTARLIATPLRQAMEEVSRVSGARVQWLGGVAEERPVSVGFTALPLSEALRQILGETNFMLFYASGGEGSPLTRIWISSKRTGSRQRGFTARPPASDFPSEKAEEGSTAVDATQVSTLIQTAVSTQQSAVRVEAIAQLGGYAQTDSRVRDILSHFASHESDPHVQAAASEVLAGIASMGE